MNSELKSENEVRDIEFYKKEMAKTFYQSVLDLKKSVKPFYYKKNTLEVDVAFFKFVVGFYMNIFDLTLTDIQEKSDKEIPVSFISKVKTDPNFPENKFALVNKSRFDKLIDLMELSILELETDAEDSEVATEVVENESETENHIDLNENI